MSIRKALERAGRNVGYPEEKNRILRETADRKTTEPRSGRWYPIATPHRRRRVVSRLAAIRLVLAGCTGLSDALPPG